MMEMQVDGTWVLERASGTVCGVVVADAGRQGAG
jgi:hypothetical protein